MKSIAIRWPDSRAYKTVTYRKRNIKRFNGGWVIDDEPTLYHCIECAENAIDAREPDPPRRPNAKRLAHGIRIIN